MIVRKARFAEGSLIAAWLLANRDRNHLDPDVLDYPTSSVHVAAEVEMPIAAMPVHLVLAIESLGYQNGTEPKKMVEAVDDLLTHVETQAKASGIREMIFLSSDPEVDKAAIRRGFEKVTCLRRKIR